MPACNRRSPSPPVPPGCPQGFLLITPLRQEGSDRAVMVNRGWVPSEWRQDAAAQQAGQPRGKVGGAVCALVCACWRRPAFPRFWANALPAWVCSCSKECQPRHQAWRSAFQ